MTKQVIASVILILAASIPNIASAELVEYGPDFSFRHPARTQVVYRIERIKWLADQRQHAGDFSTHETLAFKAEADGIHGEEQFFANRHGGRLTTAEQRRLNLEIDQLTKQLDA